MTSVILDARDQGLTDPIVRWIAIENQASRDDLEQMRPAQSHWEANVGSEVSSMVRQGEAASMDVGTLQQEGRHMDEFQEQRIRQTSASAEQRDATERHRGEQALQEARQEKQRAIYVAAMVLDIFPLRPAG